MAIDAHTTAVMLCMLFAVFVFNNTVELVLKFL